MTISINKRWTLTDELSRYGEVRQSGCILKTDGFTFLMYVEKNHKINHNLECESTSGERLKAHWTGFVENHARKH